MTSDRETSGGVGRRRLLAGGLATGVAAFGGLPQTAAAFVDRGDSLADGRSGVDGRPATSSLVSQVLPPLEPGARLLAIYGLSFGTFTPTASGDAAVGYVAGKGAVALSDGIRLQARLEVPTGALITAVDVYGFADMADTQASWLSRRDPTTFSYVDRATATAIGSGALHATMTVTELAEPGYEWAIVVESSPSGPYLQGALVQYVVPFSEFVAIAPQRVYDSRVADGPLTAGTERSVSVANRIGTGANVVPADARAVAVNVTVTGTIGAGWLALRPAGTLPEGTSSINWTGGGQTDSNAQPVRLGGDREVIVRAGGSGGPATHVILDVLGYYV